MLPESSRALFFPLKPEAKSMKLSSSVNELKRALLDDTGDISDNLMESALDCFLVLDLEDEHFSYSAIFCFFCNHKK